jgi:molecular chaperone DnaK (HSP70)
MKKSPLRLLVMAAAITLLTACMAPKTPQEVTQAFWQAVLHNDAEGAVEYSTLTSPKQYDAFSRDWDGFKPTWGKIVIDGDKASVASQFVRKTDDGKQERGFTTRLVRRNEVWLVDYERTAEEVRGGALGNLFGALSQLGNDLSRQMQSSARDFNADMERMGKELEERSQALGEEASRSMEQYAEALRNYIEALKESIDRALKDPNGELSDEDKEVLKEVSAELDRDSENLAEPSAESVAKSSQHLGQARGKLDNIDGDAFADYRQQWKQLSESFEEEMQKLLDALSASQKEQSKGY